MASHKATDEAEYLSKFEDLIKDSYSALDTDASFAPSQLLSQCRSNDYFPDDILHEQVIVSSTGISMQQQCHDNDTACVIPA